LIPDPSVAELLCADPYLARLLPPQPVQRWRAPSNYPPGEADFVDRPGDVWLLPAARPLLCTEPIALLLFSSMDWAIF
jgi:hypothetical protein